MPLVSPVIVIGLPAPEAEVPELGITVYDVIGLPFAEGGTKLIVAEALPATAVTPVGTPGTDIGVTAVDAVDAALAPTAFEAVTVNV